MTDKEENVNLGPSLKDRVGKIYGDLNKVCNDVDRLIGDLGLEFAGNCAHSGWEDVGEANKLFGLICAARSGASSFTRRIKDDEHTYKFQVFKDRFQWVGEEVDGKLVLMDTKHNEEVGSLSLHKGKVESSTDYWKGSNGSITSPLSSAKRSVEYEVKRYHAWYV